MARNLFGIIVAGLCIAPVCHSQDRVPKDSPKDAQTVQGFWVGFIGGGQRDGVTFLPAISELLIKGDHIELYGHPGTVTGTFRLDPKAKRMQISPTDASRGKPPAKTVDYAYEIKADNVYESKGDKLTLTFGDVTFHKRGDVVEDPLANAQVELVAAEGINGSGDLLVTEFTQIKFSYPVTQLQAGRARATYFQPQKRSLKTKGATVLVVQKTGCKKISLDEARGLIRNTVPVVITYGQDDGEAVGRMFSRILQPGTLVFLLAKPVETNVLP